MGGLELKTDEEGRTGLMGFRMGRLRVQVLAPGFQTFGEDYEIKQPETQITVRLKTCGDSTRCMTRRTRRPSLECSRRIKRRNRRRHRRRNRLLSRSRRIRNRSDFEQPRLARNGRARTWGACAALPRVKNRKNLLNNSAMWLGVAARRRHDSRRDAGATVLLAARRLSAALPL